ncbi:MAG: hypothetical protein AAF721_05010 [Myxococcota bacterium]
MHRWPCIALALSLLGLIGLHCPARRCPGGVRAGGVHGLDCPVRVVALELELAAGVVPCAQSTGRCVAVRVKGEPWQLVDVDAIPQLPRNPTEAYRVTLSLMIDVGVEPDPARLAAYRPEVRRIEAIDPAPAR